jgi:hypothetical protein
MAIASIGVVLDLFGLGVSETLFAPLNGLLSEDMSQRRPIYTFACCDLARTHDYASVPTSTTMVDAPDS